MKSRRIHPLLPLLALVVAAAGCRSAAGIRFETEARINDGLVLAVDVVRASEAEASQIRQLGAKWFYSELRDQLGLRRQTVSLTGGEVASIEVAPPEDDRAYLVVVADYHSGADSGADVQVFPPGKWIGRKLLVRVGNGALDVVGAY